MANTFFIVNVVFSLMIFFLPCSIYQIIQNDKLEKLFPENSSNYIFILGKV